MEKERSKIRAVQTDNLRGLLGIRRMDKVPNASDERVLQWFNHMEKMEKDKNAKRVYVGECAGSYSVGQLQKRWIDTVKDFKKKDVLMSGKQGEWLKIGVNGSRICTKYSRG